MTQNQFSWRQALSAFAGTCMILLTLPGMILCALAGIIVTCLSVMLPPMIPVCLLAFAVLGLLFFNILQGCIELIMDTPMVRWPDWIAGLLTCGLAWLVQEYIPFNHHGLSGLVTQVSLIAIPAAAVAVPIFSLLSRTLQSEDCRASQSILWQNW